MGFILSLLIFLLSSQLSQPCSQGLLALCALGLQTQDLVLTNAALAELATQPQDQDQDLVQKILVLDAASLYMQVFVIFITIDNQPPKKIIPVSSLCVLLQGNLFSLKKKNNNNEKYKYILVHQLILLKPKYSSGK